MPLQSVKREIVYF